MRVIVTCVCVRVIVTCACFCTFHVLFSHSNPQIFASLRRGPIECPKELGMAEIQSLGVVALEEEEEDSDEEAAAEPEEEWPALPP